MPTVSFQAPSEYQAQAQEIERRRQMADLLQKQALEPIQTQPTPPGGFAVPISWTQGLAKLLQGYGARKGQERATADQTALASKYNTERGQALAAAMRAGMGTPASSETIMDETANGGEGQMAQINAPAVPGSRQAMIAQLTGSKFPELQQAGMSQVLKDAEPYTLAPGASRFGPGGQVIANNPKPHEGFTLTPGGTRFDASGKPIANLPEKSPKDEGAWGDPYQMGGAWVQKNSLTGQVRQAVAREPVTHVSVPPPITAVTLQDPNDPSGTIIVDGRTRQVIGKGPRLTDTGKMDKKREFNMQGIGATIQSAEELLKGTGDKAPTQSGVGTVMDAAGALIGRSPRGAAEADRLKAIGGALVSKVPRMEGPQSDKDVALYKEMAGQVGNSTLPAARRLAALEEVKNLWAKYERLNPEAFADRRASANQGSNVIDFSALPK